MRDTPFEGPWPGRGGSPWVRKAPCLGCVGFHGWSIETKIPQVEGCLSQLCRGPSTLRLGLLLRKEEAKVGATHRRASPGSGGWSCLVFYAGIDKFQGSTPADK